MYKTITLKGCSEPIQCDKGPVIFVGPNGVGKSLLLRELTLDINTIFGPNGSIHIRNGLIFEKGISKTINPKLHKRLQAAVRQSEIIFKNKNTQVQLSAEPPLTNQSLTEILSLLRLNAAVTMSFMDGKHRFNFSQSGVGKDLHTGGESLHAKLFTDKVLLERLRDLLHDAFDLFFVLDPMVSHGNFTIRFSKTRPKNNEERMLDDKSSDFHKSATLFNEFSDGVKAYTAILTTFIASDELLTFLVDEPEAFLHPPLASLLGKQLSEVAAERDCNLFAATHSPDFLKGCIQSGKPVQIVRMERINDVSKIRSISADELRNLLQDPIIRSTNVLSGLFAEGVIVVEGDSDRVFYNEIYERLRAVSKVPKLLPLFINGNGIPTVFQIAKALRRFGVPAAAIVDFDVFCDDSSWLPCLPSIFIDRDIRDSIKSWRAKMKNQINGKEGWKKGAAALSEGHRQLFDSNSNILAKHGLFVVPNGGLESWLSSLGVPSENKKKWLREILGKMGSDPNDQNYIQPDKGDVWDFIQNCVDWLANPDRNGMPKQSEANSTAPSPSVIKETSAVPSL